MLNCYNLQPTFFYSTGKKFNIHNLTKEKMKRSHCWRAEPRKNSLRVLDERNFPMDELVLFGSKRSAGTTYTFRGKQIEVKPYNTTMTLGSEHCFHFCRCRNIQGVRKNNHQVWCCDDRQLQRIPYGCRCTFGCA